MSRNICVQHLLALQMIQTLYRGIVNVRGHNVDVERLSRDLPCPQVRRCDKYPKECQSPGISGDTQSLNLTFSPEE